MVAVASAQHDFAGEIPGVRRLGRDILLSSCENGDKLQRCE
jgi:hypothetical protein